MTEAAVAAVAGATRGAVGEAGLTNVVVVTTEAEAGVATSDHLLRSGGRIHDISRSGLLHRI